MSKGTFYSGTGHYYEYYFNEKTWEEADSYARSQTWNGVDGYLLDVFDSAENDFIQDFIHKELEKNKSIWTNLNDRKKEGEYRYSGGEKDGSLITWDNWAALRDPVFGIIYAYQPDNAGNEDNIGIYNTGFWNDFNDSVKLDYIVEYGRPGAEYKLENLSISNGVEGKTDPILTFTFDREVPAEIYFQLNFDLYYQGVKINGGDVLSNIGNGDLNFPYFGGEMGVGFKGPSPSKEFKVAINKDHIRHNDNAFGDQIKEFQVKLNSTNTHTVEASAQTVTGYFLEDESEISLGNGLIQKIYLPNTGDNGSNTTTLDKKIPDYTLLDTEINYHSNDDFYSKLRLDSSFSIRWETYISIPESGTYTFGVTNDDGVRLTIRDQNEYGSQIGSIDSWKPQGSTDYSTEVKDLKKGDVVWLQYDYYQALGGAQAHLQWQKPSSTTLETIPDYAMFLSEEIATAGSTLDEAYPNPELGFQFIANSQLDDDNTYNIEPKASYDLDFTLATGDKSNTYQTTDTNRRLADVGFPTDDYAIYTKDKAWDPITLEGGAFKTFRDPDSIGQGIYQWDTTGDLNQTTGQIGVSVLSDSFAEKTESISGVLNAGKGYGVNSETRNIFIGDESPKLSITKGSDATEGDWGWFDVDTGGVVIPEGGMYVYYSIDTDNSTATRITDSNLVGDFYSPSTYMMWDEEFKAENYFFLPANSTSAKVYISAIGDAIDERSETVTLKLETIPTPLKAVKKDENGDVEYSYQYEQYSVNETAASATLEILDTTESDIDRTKTDEDGNTLYTLPTYTYQAGVSITPANRTGRVEEIRSDSNNNVSLNIVLNSQPTSDVSVLLSTDTGTWSDSSQLDPKQQNLLFTPENWNTPQISIINSIIDNQLTTVSWTTASKDQNYSNNTKFKQSVVPFNYVSNLVDPKTTLWETGIELKLVDQLNTDTTVDIEDSYITSLQLVSKNRDSVLIPAGTELQYKIDAKEKTPEKTFTLILTNDLSIKTLETKEVAVTATSIDEINFVDEINPLDDRSNTSLYIASVNNTVPDIPIVSVKAIHDSEGSINKYGFQLILGSRPETEGDIDVFFNLTASEGFILEGDSNDVIHTLRKSATNDNYVITIPKGDTSAAFLLKPVDDQYAEGEEQLTLNLVANEKYQFTPESGTATAILSDDEFVGVGIFAFTSIGSDRKSSWTHATSFVVSENDPQEGTFKPVGIRLESKPTSSVTLRLIEESYSSEEIKVANPIGFEGEPIELIFTPDNWNQIQEIQIEGVDDSIIDGNQTKLLTFKVTSADSAYDNLKFVNATIVNVDNDELSANESLNTLSKSSEESNIPTAEFLKPSTSFINETGSTATNLEIKLSDIASEETIVFINRDQYVSSAEWTDVNFSAGEDSTFMNGLAQYIDNQEQSIEQTDFDGIKETFDGFNDGEFTSTWSGYLYIPESGHYNFIADIIGGFALTINGEEYLNKPTNTKGKYHVNDLILEHGDFIDITFDYIGYKNEEHKAHLLWERPNHLEETYVKEIIPAEYFHRTKGFALVIPEGEDSATLTLNAVDDTIDESSESISVKLQESTGLKLLVKSQDKVFKSNDSNNDYFLNLSLTETDRESVVLKAGTELQFGVDQIIDENTTQEVSLANFTLLEDTTFHRSRSTRATGSLIWTEDGLNSSYNESLVGLVTGHDTTLYQLLDPGVDLNLIDQLELVESTENSDGTTDFSYLASIQLGATNRGSVSIPAGTELNYVIAATDETDVQNFTLYLKNELTINSEETVNGIAVTSNSRDISIGLDLTQIDPVPNEELNDDGLSVKSFIAEYRIERNATVDIIDDDHAGFKFSLDDAASDVVDSTAFTISEGDDAITRYVQLTSKPTAPVQLYLETDQSKKSVLKSYDQLTNEWNEGTSRIKLKFMPWDWDQPQKFQVKSIDDTIISEDVLATIHTEVQSVDPFYEEQTIFLTVIDSLTVQNSDNNSYLATLKLDPTDRADDTIRIPSGTTLNYSIASVDETSSQRFTLTLADDLNIKSDQQIADVPVFVSNSTDGLDLTSIDPSTISEGDTSSYKASYEIPSSTISFLIQETDTPVIEAKILQNEIAESSNGFVTLRLNNQPSNPVTLNLTPSDQQFTIGDRGVGMQDSLVFTPKNWDVIQSVEIRSVNDELVEDITTSQLNIISTSDDPNFDQVSNTIHIDIVSEDLPTATIVPIVDSSEEAEPGRFRIHLSDPAPDSAGSTGVVVQYEIDSLSLDQRTDDTGGPALGYDTNDENIDKITQSPGVTTGEVRIAPGQAFSDVLVVPIDDRYADEFDKSFSVSLLKSVDNTYEIADDENNSTTVNIINNDIAGIYTQLSGEFLRVSENDVGPGVCAVGLLTKPAGEVTITITEESIEKDAEGNDIFQLSKKEGAFVPFERTLTFGSADWYVPQMFEAYGWNEGKIEDGEGDNEGTGIHKAKLKYEFVSKDEDYNSSSHIEDPEHFTNTLQDVEVVDKYLEGNVADSIQNSLIHIQDGINTLDLPLLGNLDGKTGSGVSEFLHTLTDGIRSIGQFTPRKLESFINDQLISILGPRDDDSQYATITEPSINDIANDFKNKWSLKENDLIATLDFSFGKDKVNIGSVPLDADLGIPGFGLQSSGSVDAFYGYDANLGLVFSSNENYGYIYLDTKKTKLEADLSAALSDDASFTGALGFLQLDAKNQASENGNVKITDPQTREERPAKTEMYVEIDLDLNNSDGSGDDGILTFDEITALTSSTAIKNLFNYDIQGDSAMSFGVETTIDGSAAIPSFSFDLASLFPLFDYSNTTEARESTSATSIYFDNIKLDLGSYISNMLSPVVDGIDDILTPLYPVVDALYSDTEIFSNLGLVSTFDMDGDNQVSPIDLSNWFADFYAGMDQKRGKELQAAVESTTEFLSTVKGVMDLVRDLEEISVSGDNFTIDYGNYELAAFKAGNAEAETPKVKEDEVTKELGKEDEKTGDAARATEDDDGNINPFAGVMSQLDELGFNIPLIDDPSNAINLLLGQDVDLFTWEMPGMGMSAELEKTFPVYPGIEGVIQGAFGVDAHIGFGFDTYGLNEWKDSDFELDDAWKVFNGFYVSDWDENGKDIPEFTLDASMGAGMGINAVVVRADMTGGINAGASLDLLDEGEIAGTSDGKIRGEEITSRIDNPLSLFELVGDLTAALEAKVQVGIDLYFYSYWETVWQEKLATIPIFEFGVGGSYGSGTASNGYLDGSTVFFDHNFNGRIESLEPSSITGEDAHYNFRVDHQIFDVNQNGSIDLSEGWVMALGGNDSSTGLSLEMPFVAPLGEMLTPITTIHTLAIHSGYDEQNVQKWINQAFSLGGFNYLAHDPVLDLQAADTINDQIIQDSLNAYLAHVKIHLGLDVLSTTLKNALPDTSHDTTEYDLELMNAYTTALFEQSSSTPLKTLLFNAINDTSQYLHLDEKENFKYILEKVTKAAAEANFELSERLDSILAQGIEENRSPTELIDTINTLKTYVATEYRENVENLSHDLHLIADLNTEGVNDDLRNTIDQRLEDLHSDFVPRTEQVLDLSTGEFLAGYEIGTEYSLSYIRDFDGNLQGGNHNAEMESSYEYQGFLDINGDGEKELIYTNKESKRWVTAEVDPLTGQIDYDDNGADGSTRIVGIYEDPLIAEGEANNGFLSDGVTPAPANFGVSDEDRYVDMNGDRDFNDDNEDRLALNSQVRFQNDLAIDNLTVKTAGDYDGDGVHEVYWKTNDGTAYLRALMHDDGNIKYANYQSEAEMTDYLTTQGHDSVVEEIV